MSRTKRIYNREIWKKRALRHFYANYYNGSVFCNIFYGVREGVSIESESIWGGSYSYTRYKQICMGCCESCGREKRESIKLMGRENHYREKEIKKNWRNELENYYGDIEDF